MYHIYKNGEEIDKVKYWSDVVKYAENEGFSRRYDCNQSDTNHWYFTKTEKSCYSCKKHRNIYGKHCPNEYKEGFNPCEKFEWM